MIIFSILFIGWRREKTVLFEFRTKLNHANKNIEQLTKYRHATDTIDTFYISADQLYILLHKMYNVKTTYGWIHANNFGYILRMNVAALL